MGNKKKSTAQPVGDAFWEELEPRTRITEKEWEPSGGRFIKRKTTTKTEITTIKSVLMVRLTCGHALRLSSDNYKRNDGSYMCIECTYPEITF